MSSARELLSRRVSTRAFLPTPLSQAVVVDILDAARQAPSGGNLQPWKVIAVAGEARQAVIDLTEGLDPTTTQDESQDRPVFPAALWDPYRSRRFKVGEDLYGLLAIPRSDREGRIAQLKRNFQFFGAPVGLFFVIDERLGHAQWAHLGMFMQSVVLSALDHGVSSCMQEAWAWVRRRLARHFELPPHEMVYCGMALGYADESAKINALRTERVPVSDFATFRGFDGRGGE